MKRRQELFIESDILETLISEKFMIFSKKTPHLYPDGFYAIFFIYKTFIALIKYILVIGIEIRLTVINTLCVF